MSDNLARAEHVMTAKADGDLRMELARALCMADGIKDPDMPTLTREPLPLGGRVARIKGLARYSTVPAWYHYDDMARAMIDQFKDVMARASQAQAHETG